MTVPARHIKAQWGDIAEMDRALRSMHRLGIDEASEEYKTLWKARGAFFGKMGFRVPKPITLIARLFGFSPGELRLYHDADTGFMVEGRARPEARPAFHYVDDETAIAIIKGEVTHELEAELMAPDTYAGE